MSWWSQFVKEDDTPQWVYDLIAEDARKIREDEATKPRVRRVVQRQKAVQPSQPRAPRPPNQQTMF